MLLLAATLTACARDADPADLASSSAARTT
jgi:hypothetical protein